MAGRAPAVAVAAIALVGVAAGQASAGTYVVSSCQAPGADGRNNAWTPHVDAYPGVEPQPTAYAVAQECGPGGRGLYVESTGGADARFLTSAYFKFTAPAGTRIVQLKVTRSGDKQRLSNDAIGDGWTVSGNGDGNAVVGGVFGETCSIPNGAPSCSPPGTTPAPYPLNTSQLTYGIACTRADTVNPYNCPVAANGVPAARLGVRATEVTLSDDSALTLSAAGPLLSDGWVPGARRTPAATTTTDGQGRFSVRVPAGPSRVLRLAFDGGAGALRTVRALSLRVPASTTIAPSRRAVVGTGRVRFRGTVARRGQPIPRGGLTILLQGRQHSGWRTFKAARTDRQGRWRATYRFTGRPGSYPIRAFVRRSPAFPFDAGTSRVVRVRVR